MSERPAPARLRTLAELMDASVRVPGTRFRFGLDAVLGLVPGLGDLAGALVSGFIVFQGARLGVAPAGLFRMVATVALEALVGAVPLVGDLFDASWRANIRNVELIELHLADPTLARRAGKRAVILGVLAAAAVVVAGAAAVLVGLWSLALLVRSFL